MVAKKHNENDVRVMFSPYGTIEECHVLRDTSGNSRGELQSYIFMQWLIGILNPPSYQAKIGHLILTQFNITGDRSWPETFLDGYIFAFLSHLPIQFSRKLRWILT